ncbi:MAG TPA: CocE/NonD family hydrolase [Solirubrobacteraceae bacterium]|jgi:ABC-2 type transport system ATP-binding protein|nr:CocE/NonD family hydrolase [Solirubrobacteraceae bacterium]
MDTLAARGGRWRAAGLVALIALLVLAVPAVVRAESFTVQTLHFTVHVGPNGGQSCDVIGDLYRPADATAQHPDPAVLTTNGFGGSKNDQAPLARQLAANGYVVLSYSGLGFGGSGCTIELDSPEWDGAAASQLVTFLGGGSAATDGTTVDYVIHDQMAHNGVHYADDPRVGMIGGSYGGEVQFAAAEQDPRIDTIVPIITWNDLSYSLTPNDANLPSGSVSDPVGGLAKYEWAGLFTADGLLDGLSNPDLAGEISDCPNFDPRVCSGLIGALLTGAPSDDTVALLRSDSVVSYMQNIRIPTLLMQGEDDTLFNLNEAVATYEALRAQFTPVKMVWQSWGHSHSTPAPGELGPDDTLTEPNGSSTYEGTTLVQWLGHYLKGNPAAPSLDFTFFRPWVSYTGDASVAYGRTGTYPVGHDQSLYLSGSSSLVSAAGGVTAGTASFLAPALGAPTSLTEISGLSQSVPTFDLPGTYAEYETPPVAANTDVIGIPTATVRIQALVQNLTGGLGALGDLALVAKIYDLSPSGAITLPDRLVAPLRIADLQDPVQIEFPGIVHRFPAGDRIALVIAGGDAAYRGNNVPAPVSIVTSPSDPGVLQLPVAPPGSYGAVVGARVPPARGPAKVCASNRTLTLHLRARYRGRVRSARVMLGTRTLAVFRRGRDSVRINLEGLPVGPAKLRIVMRLRNGRTVVDVRHDTLCASSR